jgi:hypothetical protein
LTTGDLSFWRLRVEVTDAGRDTRNSLKMESAAGRCAEYFEF